MRRKAAVAIGRKPAARSRLAWQHPRACRPIDPRRRLWSSGATITARDISEALLDLPASTGDDEGVLNRPIENGVDLMQELARHYLRKALSV